MQQDFQFIQNLVSCLCGVEVHLVPGTREGYLSLVESIFQDMLPNAQIEPILGRTLQSVAPGRVYHLNSPLGLRFALFRHHDTGQVLVVGPCREEAASEKEQAEYLQALGISKESGQKLLAYCRQLPSLSYDRLYNLSQLLVEQLAGPDYPLSQEELILDLTLTQSKALLQTRDYTLPDQIRDVETRYEASAVMTEAIKQGNLSLAYRYVQKMSTIPKDLIRNDNTLRNSQNLCIIMNTQLRYALEVEGIHPYQLDQLSGGIARQIEKLKSPNAANSYFSQILRQYCELVQAQRYQGLPPLGRQAVAYIHTHLSDNLTVKSAAKALLMNADYLSHRFRQEVGISFIEYVNQERVRQAAGLLSRTNLQVQQIAAAVGYNNTSYFTRQFVHFQGCTPSAWRSGKTGACAR